MQTTSSNITNLQVELMKVFSFNLEESQLFEIKQLLALYFAEKATNEMDNLWEEKKWSDETMQQWLREHNRTSYK